ncbi:ABC transporter ATP-binding protein [Gracilibacillus oryzae]|uniref:ABC transporter ATP-binding protein n=1 Tax=Gracilibacillus oryzae TaxID=1672701 RepID=A0A7C8GVT4_9BACI|nr:ABC transporter ATP-binding protein [Gracilibacillus oryzae]KAB8139368.1 ABC transporter ATP-binding protein [Gracilibacillus oryzae]
MSNIKNKASANLSQIGLNQGPGSRPGEIAKVRSKNVKETIRRIWSYLKVQRLHLLIVFISTILSTCFTLLSPYLIGKTIDNYIVVQQFDGVLKMGGILFIVYVSGALFTWIQQFFAASLSQHTVRDMRQDLFEKYQGLPIKFFDKSTHGDLMSRTTNDIANVSNTLNQTVVQLISSIFMLAGSVVMMLSLSIRMTLITIFIVPTVAYITKKITTYTKKYFSEQQSHLGSVNGFVQENITGLKVTKAFGREAVSLDEFRVINEKLRAVGVKAQSLSGSMGPIMNTMRNLSFVVIAVFGGIFAYHEIITIGIIVSFLNYSNQFSQPINQLANQYNLLQSAIAGAERVFEVLDQPSEENIEKKTDVDKKIKGEVNFDKVYFHYETDVAVLKNLSLHAKPGEMVALVGPTGAGKTTIINLLTRFYEIQSGKILIDGKDIRQMDKDYLRQQIGLVLQDAYVFSGTIMDNIRYGRLDATDQEVEEAAKLANAHSFIQKLPKGYETYITSDGSISQGQRQLLTIARAVLANPSILILDEATSSVDTRTERHIQEAMKSLMKGRTSFVIAHRLSTIQEADTILVLDNGEIIESGSHKELVIKNGFYQKLYENQLA